MKVQAVAVADPKLGYPPTKMYGVITQNSIT
jgi:hypothetical protein